MSIHKSKYNESTFNSSVWQINGVPTEIHITGKKEEKRVFEKSTKTSNQMTREFLNLYLR